MFERTFLFVYFWSICKPNKTKAGGNKKVVWLENVCFVSHISRFFFSATPPFSHLVQNSTVFSHNRNHTKFFAAVLLFLLPACDSVESVNDGLFHTVQLLIQNRSLSLVVDSGAPKSLGKLARQPSVDHNTQLYIGGNTDNTHTQGYKCSAQLNFSMNSRTRFQCMLTVTHKRVLYTLTSNTEYV